jgi:hypothetical protein
MSNLFAVASRKRSFQLDRHLRIHASCRCLSMCQCKCRWLLLLLLLHREARMTMGSQKKARTPLCAYEIDEERIKDFDICLS